MEQRQYARMFDYVRLYGKPHQVNMSCRGLNPGQMARDELSHNPVNTESYLFGIGSVNLVNPQSPTVPQPIYPNIVKPTKFFTPVAQVIYPEPLIVDYNNRPWQSGTTHKYGPNLYGRN